MKSISRKSIAGGGLNAHVLVASVAIEMAQEMFELYAKDNDVYRRLKADGKVSAKDAEKFFVERVAPRFLESARLALTDVLANPATTDHDRSLIHEALVLDNELRANRTVAEENMKVPTGLFQ